MITEWGSQFTRGLWRYIRPRFGAAGQDSFTDPPAQNEDMFMSMVNVMPPVQGDLDRRWGYQLFNSTLPEGASNLAQAYPMALFINDPPTTRSMFVNGATGVYQLDEAGNYLGVNLTSVPSPARMAVSRNYLYLANGKQRPQKWTTALAGATQNWGTDVNNVAASAISQYAGAAANGSGSGTSWVNPSNAIGVPDTAYATISYVVPAHGSGHDQGLNLSTYGFSGGIVTGIQVSVTGFQNNSPIISNVSLINNGGIVGTTKVSALPVGSPGTVVFGGPGDLWGATWPGSVISGTGFGVQIATSLSNRGNSPVTGQTSIDAVQITIFFSALPILVGTPSGVGGTAVTLVSGRIYSGTFYNSVSQTFSDLFQFSLSTGPVTNQSIPLSQIPTSQDPQIDRLKILATGDGGDETVLYEVADLTNGTTTYTDNTPEATLLLANQWQGVLSDGTPVGVANNAPPNQAMQFPTLHRGRMYGLVGSNLVYSKNDSELITPTLAAAGNFEECFPGLNNFPATNSGEQGRGLLSDGTVLYIGTDRRIVRLFGDGPATFLQPQVLFDNVGILNQDVWKLVLLEGNPVGAMWISPERHVFGSDFNTYQDVGTPIQNVLNTINIGAALNTAWAATVSIDVFNLFILAVPTGANTQPDTLCVFDLKGRKWYVWALTDVAVGGLWWVAVGGQPQLVIQAASGKTYLFNPAVFQDRVNDTPVSFPVQLQTSWLNFGDGTARKFLQEIEVTTGDAAMTVTVEGASSVGEFASPNTVALNAPLVTKPRGSELAVYLAGSFARDRYYRFTFNATDTQTDILRAFNIRGRVIHRE
jgi:hypothetical protein